MILDWLGDWLSPPRCAACSAALVGGRGVFCVPCAASVETCEDATDPIAFAEYGGAMARAVQRFKYEDSPELARPLGALLCRACRKCELWADAIVPVPLHVRRLARRGYNQSALLGRHVARLLGAPLVTRALERAVDTVPQVDSARDERRANVEGAFRVTRAALVHGRTIALVDDVSTTGATLHSCRLALVAAGARRVTSVVLARTVPSQLGISTGAIRAPGERLQFQDALSTFAALTLSGEVTVAGSGEKWRWADPQGVQRVMHSDELRSALAGGVLPAYTLVWRPGMQEWVPAYQVAELATVAISAQQGILPSVPPPPLAIIAVQAEFEHRVASFDEGNKGLSKIEEEPPPPPVHQYDAIAAAVPPHIMQAAQAAAQPPGPKHLHTSIGGYHAPVVEPPAPAAATPAPRAVAPAPIAATPAPPAVTPAPPAAADVDDDAKTWVAKPAVVGPHAPPSTKPPVVPRAPTAPKPPVVAPPRATPSQVPPEPVHASAPAKIVEPASAPESMKLPPPSGIPPARAPVRPADAAHAGPLPPLPGALRSAPPPPPRRSQPTTHSPPVPGAGAAGLPHAPLPMPVPPAPKPLDLHAPPLVLPAPPGFPPPSNGGAFPLPHLAPPPVQASTDAATPSVHDLPAFPLDEIQPDDIEEDEDETSDPMELPLEHGIGAKVADGIRSAKSSIGPLATRAKASLGPLAGKAKDRISPLAGRTKQWFSTKVGPGVARGFAYVKANPKDPKVIAGLGGAALLVLVLLIALAAASGGKSGASAEVTETPTEPESNAASKSKSNASAAVAPTAAKAVEPAAVETRPARGGACRLTKDASRLAGKASKDVPLEVAVNAAGDRARIGFATEAGVSQGLAVDLGTLKAVQEFSAPSKGKPRAVIPLGAEGKANFVVNVDAPGDKLHAWRTLSSESLIGWADGAISVASKPGDPPTAVWPLEGDDAPDAFRVAAAGDLGHAVAFRRKGEIFGGTIDRDQKPRGNASKVSGAGAPAGSPVGAPALATNGHAVAIAFADRANASDPWGVRIGASALGLFPTQTRALAVPPGGPGGAALAPALAGLTDGRWLVVWTEGSGGNHDVRAQTLDAELRPAGAPVTVSHGSNNAGQGAVALSGGQGVVAYLALTDQGYEVWGAAVDCR